jgi:hypothetical protein
MLGNTQDSPKGYKGKNKKKIALTSICSHREEKAKGSYVKQNAQVLMILEGNVMNSRQIHKQMCRLYKYLELSSCHRAINSLMKLDKIEIARRDKCPYTDKTVRFYRLKNNENT